MAIPPISQPVLPTSNVAPDMLSSACKSRDLDFVLLALKKGAKPDDQTLTWACMSNNTEIVNAVLAVGAQPDSETLTTACSTYNFVMVTKALAAGAKAGAKTMEIALQSQNANIIDAVTRAGAPAAASQTLPVSAPPPVPATPNQQGSRLTLACKTRDLRYVKEAILAGEQPDALTLNSAIDSQNPEIVQAVIAVGAKPTTYDLTLACQGNIDIARAVVFAGALPDGNTFTTTLKHGDPEGNMLRLVFSVGAQPDAESLTVACQAVFSAAWRRYGMLVKNHGISDFDHIVLTAIQAGAKPDKKTLAEAFQGASYGILNAVLNAGAEPDEGALTKACEWGEDIVLRVLAAGGKPMCNPPKGVSTTISMAIGRNLSMETMKKLIEAGGVPTEDDFDYAINAQRLDVINVFVGSGMNPTQKNLTYAYKRARWDLGANSGDCVNERKIYAVVNAAFQRRTPPTNASSEECCLLL
jgi:hypothetical protein